MSKIYKVGATITPILDSERDFFGLTGFRASYLNKATGDVTTIVDAFSEVIKSVVGNASVASGISVAGQRMITVVDGTQFSDGDVISDAGGNFYYILEISGNTLEVKTKLKVDIADADAITEVGNTGLYKVSFSIATAGEYSILMSNPSANMQNEVVSVEVADETIDDVQTKLDEIQTELGISKTEVKFRAYV